MNSKEESFFFMDPLVGPPTNEVMTHACVHIKYFKVGSWGGTM